MKNSKQKTNKIFKGAYNEVPGTMAYYKAKLDREERKISFTPIYQDDDLNDDEIESKAYKALQNDDDLYRHFLGGKR